MNKKVSMEIIWNHEKYTMNTNLGRKQKKEEDYFFKKMTTSSIADFNLGM